MIFEGLDLATIRFALEVSRDEFRKHARITARVLPKAAEQYEAQARKAEALIARIAMEGGI